MARVRSAISDAGHLTEVVRCGGIFSSHCVSMSGANLSFQSSAIEKRLVCRTCCKRSLILDKPFTGKSILFEGHLDSNDLALAKKISSDCNFDDWENFKFRGFSVGAIAAYEILLTHKIGNREFPPEVWDEYLSNLVNTILVIIVADRILRKTKPERVAVYNSLYSLNNG